MIDTFKTLVLRSQVASIWKKFSPLAVLALFLVGGWYAVSYNHHSSAQVPQGPVFIDSSIELVPAGDLNEDGHIGAGDIVEYRFDVVNRSGREFTFTTLETGIDTSVMYDIWNLRGAASLNDNNETITLPNLRIPPHSKVSIGFEATLKFFTEGELELTVSPRLVASDSQPVPIQARERAGKKNKQTVKKWEGKLPDWVIAPVGPNLENPSVSPSPETSPEPTVEPTPEPAPESSPDPSPELSPSPEAS